LPNRPRRRAIPAAPRLARHSELFGALPARHKLPIWHARLTCTAAPFMIMKGLLLHGVL